MAEQFPLFETRPSLRGLATSPATRPGAVFVGVGVASGRAVSDALPFDVLGLLLGAEQVRLAAGAPELIVLIADAHALAHDAPARPVHTRAAAYEDGLQRVAQTCGLRSMRIVRATDMHRDSDYRSLLRMVEQRAPAATGAYVTREVADIAHLDRVHGGLIKVGWALQASAHGALRDERMFDGRFREWVDGAVGFVYTKAGRALDDGRHKVPPYLEWDPTRRICLEPNEDAVAKLHAARQRTSESTHRGVRNHLRAISRTYGKLVRPLRGSVEVRTQSILDDLFRASEGRAGGHVGALAVDPC